jgi:hypothetical protein
MAASFAFSQSMAVGGAQRQAIDLPDLRDFFQGLRRKRRPTFESMKDNALKQVAETHIFQLSHRFQHFEQPLFQANACLYPDDFDAFVPHGYQCTMVGHRRQGRIRNGIVPEAARPNQFRQSKEIRIDPRERFKYGKQHWSLSKRGSSPNSPSTVPFGTASGVRLICFAAVTWVLTRNEVRPSDRLAWPAGLESKLQPAPQREATVRHRPASSGHLVSPHKAAQPETG